MSIPVLIIGKSGTGKSTSLRNLDPNEVLLIQTLKKPLPFKSKKWKPWDNDKKTGSIYVTDKATHMIKIIQKAKENGKKIVIIDDFQYQMSNNFMRRTNEKGFQKFTDIARDAWDVVQSIIDSDDDLRVYILSHSDQDEFGENIRMKTIGKLLDDKIVMEGMFTIVLRSIINDGDYLFTTKNNGSDTVKSPMDLFDSELIPNDLNEIDCKICDYYEINTNQELLEKIELLKSDFDDEDFIKTIETTVSNFKNNSKKLISIINKLEKKKGAKNE